MELWKVRTKEGPGNVEVEIKFCCLVCLFGFLFLAGLDPHLMSARRGQRSAAAAAERELKRTHFHPNEAACSRHSSSGAQGQDQGRAEQRYRVDFHATAKASSSGRPPLWTPPVRVRKNFQRRRHLQVLLIIKRRGK